MRVLSIEEDLSNISSNVNLDSFSSKSILITGGGGFLGSWICDSLLKIGAKIFCLDNLSTGVYDNISHLKNEKNFSFLKYNVNQNLEISEKFDVIIHMASRPSPDDYVKFPVDTLDANSKGTYNILELGRKCNSTILFASTSEVYGDSNVIPTPENYWGNVNPVGIRSCYDEGKRFSEALLMAYHRQYRMNVKIVRIFNTYGPRIRADGAYGRALPRFILQALKNDNITIHGNGLQTRSFCYVTDTITGILRCLVSKETIARPINIGNPNEITILELARKIISETNSSSSISYIERPSDDPQRRCPDISTANKILSWTPEVDLDKGLQKTISWFRNTIIKK